MTQLRFSPTSALVGMLLGVALAPSALAAQFTTLPEPASYALQNVVVVRSDGRRTTGVTIVVRNGLIEAMGTDVQTPPDAEILEGDSLTVYPGLVDASGKADYEFPASETDRTKIKSWAPARDVQSFTPHRRVVDYLTSTGGDFESARKEGVVAAAVLADGRLMPGSGTLLLLRKDAATPQELIINPAIGLSMSLRGARGVYPTQLFAVMAFIRQSFEDAQRDGVIHQAYAKNPSGMTRPKWDPDYAALREVLEGVRPVFFEANNAEDIRNVLKLAEEYSFRPTIVGGEEAWKVADQLKNAGVPVLVSLDFPKPKRWKPKKEESDTTAAETGEELEPAVWREKKQMEERYANAGRLAEAGVTFALTSGGGKAKLRDGARKAIEYGLSEETALAALSAVPASLLGIPTVAMVDEGMPATFLVSNGPLFDEDTRIAYTFVEGHIERGETEAESVDSGDAPSVDLTGTWEVEMGEFSATMKLTQKEASFSGNMSTDFGNAVVKSGTVSGSTISFVVVLSAGGESFEITFSGTADADSASGSGDGPQGEFEWTAKRTSGPGEEAIR